MVASASHDSIANTTQVGESLMEGERQESFIKPQGYRELEPQLRPIPASPQQQTSHEAGWPWPNIFTGHLIIIASKLHQILFSLC